VKVTGSSVTLTLNVNAPGTVKVTGSGVKSKTTSVTPGTVKVKVSLTSQEKKVLAKKGKVKLKLTVAYSPTGGSTLTKKVSVVIKKNKK
jgi:hypothetical protein